MPDKNKSIFKALINTVSKLPWLKGTLPPVHKKMKPGKDFNQPVSIHAFDYLKELNDEEFEKLITLIFKQRGYTIADKNKVKYDHIDAVLHMNNVTTFIQYKHWREHQLDVAAIEDLYSVMDAESVKHGIVITTGIFTEDALDFALGKALLLINGVDLSQMVEVLRTSSNDDGAVIDDAKTDDTRTNATGTNDTSVEARQEMPELEPLCPICSQKMIKRTAKKGKNAGNTFWGCSQFPNCRGVVSN